MREPRAQAAYAALILLAVVAGLHRQVVFAGRSLIHTNYSNPIDWRPLYDNYGPDMVPHDEWTRRGQWPFPNIRDPGATWWQWEPSTEFFKQTIADREWPFWDPYVAAGTPAMANLVQAFFFPPYVLLVLLGATVTLKNAYFLVLLWAASWATYLFLRRHDLGFTASLGGGLVVSMSGAMNQNLGAFAGQTIACLPFTLHATRIFLDRPDARTAALVAVTYAAAALASFPPILIGVFGVTALYAFCGIALGGGAGSGLRRHQAIWWSLGTALAGGLVAFCYLPAFVLRHATPQVVAGYAGSAAEAIPFVKGLQLLSPTVTGGVQVYWNDPFLIIGAAHIPYVGAIAVLAAAFARPGEGRRRVLFWSCLGATIIVLLKLFGVPPVQWISRAPLFEGIHFSHYLGVVLAVPVAGLAAIGLERLTRTPSRFLAVVAPVGVSFAALYAAWRFADASGVIGGPTAATWRADWNFLVAVIAAGLTVVVSTLFLDAVRTRAVVVGVLLTLVAAEGFYNNTYPRPKRWDMFAHASPYVRVLKREAGITRVFPFGVPAANVNEAFGVFSIGSLMAFNPPRIYTLYHEYAAAPRQVFLREASRLPPDGVLDRMNVSFVGTYSALAQVVDEAKRRGNEPQFSDGFFTLYRRNTPPRFFSSDYRVLPAAKVLKTIATAPAREVLLETTPLFPITANRTDDPDVPIESFGRNAVSLAVDAPRRGRLCSSESAFEGWSASVNGAPALILTANYAFCAVVLPAGRAHVAFRYWPPGLTAGLAISGLSVLVIVALLLFSWRRS